MKDKVVLAFSGGLDTSYCAKYLSEEMDLTVHSLLVQTGGFTPLELEEIEKKAMSLGVVHHETIDVTQEYYERCIKYMVFGNVLKNNTYPLSVSSERVFQAIAVAEYANKINARYIAHGSTGAGNDQIRFDLVFQILAPERQILTPIRDNRLSREAEIKYLKEHGIKSDWEKALYSINKGLWGTSVGGRETLTSNKPLPEEAYPSILMKTYPLKVELLFEKGELKGIDDESMDTVSAIRKLEKIGSDYAIGRDIHVGDTIIGIKGRVGFEAPAPLMIIKAHHALEKHVLTKWQMYWKEQLSNWYGMMLHEAQYLDPVMRNIEKFLEDSQTRVTGKVILLLKPYTFSVLGIESEYDLMRSEVASYGEMNNAWGAYDVKGFTKILANQLKIYQGINKK